MKKIYINSSFTNGIESYLLKKENKPFPSINTFELKIVEILIAIYGEIDIINPYKTGIESSIIGNIQKYGLDKESVLDFFNLLNQYRNWLESSNRTKNNIIINIYYLLIKMVLLKNSEVGLSKEEFREYDYFFRNLDERFHKLIELTSENFDEVIRYWNSKSKSYILKRSYVFNEIEPNLLTNTMYQRHGVTIDDIRNLSNFKINEINELIINDEKDLLAKREKHQKKHSTFNLVFSCGNGFVDSLVLISIIFTELLIGFLVAITIGRLG